MSRDVGGGAAAGVDRTAPGVDLMRRAAGFPAAEVGRACSTGTAVPIGGSCAVRLPALSRRPRAASRAASARTTSAATSPQAIRTCRDRARRERAAAVWSPVARHRSAARS